MGNKIARIFSANEYRNSYIIVGILAAASYYFVRQMLIDQSAWGFVLTSLLTLNLIVMFGLWGAFHRYIFPARFQQKLKKNFALDWGIVFGGFIIIVLVLRVYGMRTIFG